MDTQKEKAEQHWNKIDTLVVGEMKRVMIQFINEYFFLTQEDKKAALTISEQTTLMSGSRWIGR